MSQLRIKESTEKSNNLDMKKYNFKKNTERLSLAYRYFNKVPKKLITLLGETTKTLDLSHNDIKNLSFLSSFPYLHTLILDRNINLNFESLPVMKHLNILWLNNCNIINTYHWIYQLQKTCPELRQLSMMCNPVGSTTLNGLTDYEEKQYRRKISKLLPTLEYFDGTAIGRDRKMIKQLKKLRSLFNFKISLK